MAKRGRPLMTGFRVTAVEMAQLQELAEAREVPVSQILRERVMPWAREEWEGVQAGLSQEVRS